MCNGCGGGDGDVVNLNGQQVTTTEHDSIDALLCVRYIPTTSLSYSTETPGGNGKERCKFIMDWMGNGVRSGKKSTEQRKDTKWMQDRWILI